MMTDNNNEENAITNSTTNNTINVSKEEKLPPSSQKSKVSSGGKMPTIINWTVSSAGSSDTMVTNSTKANLPAGHIIHKTSDGGLQWIII